MLSADEAEIQELLGELTDAWNRGDTGAFGARYRSEATFTNVNGGFYVGRDEFNLRHAEVFRGVFRGTTLALTVRKLRFLRPDVAIVDIDVGIFGCHARPPGVQVGSDGALRTCLLMVLTKDAGKWWIAAYHNVWRSTGDYSKAAPASNSSRHVC
jgi:uncharacterized protein (TIGR02246 family)